MFSWILNRRSLLLEWIPRPLGYSSAVTAFAGHLESKPHGSRHNTRTACCVSRLVGTNFHEKSSSPVLYKLRYMRGTKGMRSSKRIKDPFELFLWLCFYQFFPIGSLLNEKLKSSVGRNLQIDVLFFFFQTMADFSAEPPRRELGIPWPIHVILQRNTRGNRDTDRSIQEIDSRQSPATLVGLPRTLSKYQYTFHLDWWKKIV